MPEKDTNAAPPSNDSDKAKLLAVKATIFAAILGALITLGIFLAQHCPTKKQHVTAIFGEVSAPVETVISIIGEHAGAKLEFRDGLLGSALLLRIAGETEPKALSYGFGGHVWKTQAGKELDDKVGKWVRFFGGISTP